MVEETQPSLFYKITRKSGLVGGKLTDQPELIIKEGKVKRTVKQQAELQYNSLIKKQLDKGYKNSSDFTDFQLTQEYLAKVMPDNPTDQSGVNKPMLCKVFDFDDVKNDKNWYISKKLDGNRAFLYYKDGEVKTSSRGGQNYDIAAKYIREDPFIISIFQNNPNLILDGEIYRHGWPLNKISGLCRLEKTCELHKELSFYCYDIANEDMPFKARLALLKGFSDKSDKLFIVDHTLVKKAEIMQYHDTFINEGFEGAVVRDPEAKYKFGARDRRMQKIKIFSDGEFLIKGIVEGLRDEDMCFLMETKEGYEFKAKPVGERSLKDYYRANIDRIKGLYGTVKYFGYTNTDKPVPNLPVFKCVRTKEDM